MDTKQAIEFAQERLDKTSYNLEMTNNLPCRSFYEKQVEMLLVALSVLREKDKIDEIKARATDANFYETLLGVLAYQKGDAVECDTCGGIYREAWFDGKCPYCEVEHENCISISMGEKTDENL